MGRGLAQEAFKLFRKADLFLIILFSTGCGGSAESRLRETLAKQMTGVIHLPAAVIEVSSELRLAPFAHDLEIVGAGTIFKVANNFKGRAVFVAEDTRRIRFRDFTIDGNRVAFDQPSEMAPPENTFLIFSCTTRIMLDAEDGGETFE